ncbi:MAG: transglycosylase SLT domain-containing protein [Lautropia sp.]|nr:transglycosylase SLT domain-containing protein [Lautropia sp.]
MKILTAVHGQMLARTILSLSILGTFCTVPAHAALPDSAPLSLAEPQAGAEEAPPLPPAAPAPSLASDPATLETSALQPGVASLLARLPPTMVYVPPVVSDPVDMAILAARRAMQAGNLAAFDAAATLVPRGHVLSSYLDYWRLRTRLVNPQLSPADYQTVSADARAYLKQFPGTLTADLLRRDWMLAAGRRADWATIDTLYPRWVLKDESAPRCLASLSTLTQLHEQQRHPPLASLRYATNLLLQPQGLNSSCHALLQALADQKLLGPVQRQQRLNLALEINSPADIRQAVALLPLPPDEQSLALALNRPAALLGLTQQPPRQSARRPHRRKAAPAQHYPAPTPLLTRIALVRLARQDPTQAARLMQAGQTAKGRALRLSSADRAFVWSQIAVAGMFRLDPAAPAWAEQARTARVSDHTRVWLARAALAEQDWIALERILRAMDPALRNSPTWTYWHGRAQTALGHHKLARRAYLSLAQRGDYYGKLAREELGQNPPPPPAAPPVRAALLQALDIDSGIRQAMALYALGLRGEGNREWNFQMRGRSDEQLRAAATWAARRGLLDRAINTDERILTSPPDYQLRFPTPFAAQLLSIANQQAVDPAWVYGLIRQESRFVMQARSQVGAAGLMQIMPDTARWVARQLGNTAYRPGQIDDLSTNITFGTYYLKRALDDLSGSPVLATAGYNAGPRRAHAWRASLRRPMEGALFTELIPYTETRHYVKAVLSNTVDYATLFSGQPQSLKSWLSTITPQAMGVAQIP